MNVYDVDVNEMASHWVHTFCTRTVFCVGLRMAIYSRNMSPYN